MKPSSLAVPHPIDAAIVDAHQMKNAHQIQSCNVLGQGPAASHACAPLPAALRRAVLTALWKWCAFIIPYFCAIWVPRSARLGDHQVALVGVSFCRRQQCRPPGLNTEGHASTVSAHRPQGAMSCCSQAKLCQSHGIAHIVNNAYGIQVGARLLR